MFFPHLCDLFLQFVTEEKFTILFQSQFTVASGELVFQVRVRLHALI